MTKIEKRIKFTNKNNPRHLRPRADRFYHTEMIPLLYYIDATGISLVQGTYAQIMVGSGPLIGSYLMSIHPVG